MAFQKGLTVLIPCKQQPEFTEWLLGARPGPRDAGENQPKSCYLNNSWSWKRRAVSGVASELKGR